MVFKNFLKKVSTALISLFIFSFISLQPVQALAAHPVVDTSINCAGLSSTDLKTHMNTQVDSRLGTLASSTSLKIWNTRPAIGTSTWVRNPDLWTATGSTPLDLTGVSPFNTFALVTDATPYQRGATLISPRHFIAANHYYIASSSKLIFVNNANQPFERTVVEAYKVGNTDLMVGVLDSDVPDSVTYYPIVSSGSLLNKIYKYDYTVRPYFPLISINQDSNVYVHEFNDYSGWGGLTYVSLAQNVFQHASYAAFDSASTSYSNYAKKLEFSGTLRTGDSGQPNFMVIDGKLVFLGGHGSAGNFFYAGAYIPEINALMTQLGGGYQVTEMNLDCFNLYTINHGPRMSDVSGVQVYADQHGDIDEEVTFNPFVDENVYFNEENPLYKFTLTDADNDQIFAIISSSSAPNMQLKASGSVYTLTPTQPFSAEGLSLQNRAYEIDLQFTDSQIPNSTTTQKVYITVRDNNKPLFSSSSYAFTLAENPAATTVVGTTTATLQSATDTLAYSLIENPSNAFSINAQTGQITVGNTSLLDYESTTTIKLIVQARATLGGERAASTTLQAQSGISTTSVTITLTDVNENPVVVSGGSGGGGSSGGGSSSPAPVVVASSTSATVATTTVVAPANINCPAGFVCSLAVNNAVPSSVSTTFTRNLTVGAKGEDVRALQKFLNEQGFTVATKGEGSVGNESTYFGPATRAALIRYQKEHNIAPAQGFFGVVTRNAIQGANIPAVTTTPVPQTTPKVAPLKLGDTNADVKAMRVKLRQLGYLGAYGSSSKVPASANVELNYFGTETQAIVKKFQCDQKIVCSGGPLTTGWGVVGPKTRAALGL